MSLLRLRYEKPALGHQPSKLRVAGSSLVCRSNLNHQYHKQNAIQALAYPLPDVACSFPLVTYACLNVGGKKTGIKKQPQTGIVLKCRAQWNDATLNQSSADSSRTQNQNFVNESQAQPLGTSLYLATPFRRLGRASTTEPLGHRASRADFDGEWLMSKCR